MKERRNWLVDQRAELEDFCSFVQSYLKRRERNDQRTQTDDRYEQFLERAADLIAGLDELREEAAEKEEIQGTEP